MTKIFFKRISFLLWSVCVCVCFKEIVLWLIRAFISREQWNADKEKASLSSEGLPTVVILHCSSLDPGAIHGISWIHLALQISAAVLGQALA